MSLPYFSSKPYATPGHLLPKIGGKKKEIMDQCKPSLKRKTDAETGMLAFNKSLNIIYLIFNKFVCMNMSWAWDSNDLKQKRNAMLIQK